MLSATFELSTHRNLDTIFMPGTRLQITVYPLETVQFWPHADKLQFYGDDHGSPLAFEVETRDPDPDDVTAAIKWYARYLDYPDMDLSSIDPRPPVTLRPLN